MRLLNIKAKDNVFQLDHKGFSAKLFLPYTFIPNSLVIWIISGIFATYFNG